MTESSEGMSVEQTLQRGLVDLSPKQFDQLIVFLLRKLDPTATVDFIPLDTDADLNLVVETIHPFLDLRYGVKLEQRSQEAPVSKSAVRALAANVEEVGLHTGVLITTGTIPEPVTETASQLRVSTIDGAALAALLIKNELGFTRDDDTIELNSAFWELFRGQERSNTIPSLEVPQADSIDRLDQTLEAVAAGNHDKAAIADAVAARSGESFDPRQADYYGTAGWLLGFLHKEYEGGSGERPGRWGLTRLGKTYLEHRRTGETKQAEELLQAQIRQIEIIRRILHQLKDATTMRRDEIASIVDEETALGGSTVDRRALTIVRWLEHLSAISTSGSGASQQIRYEPAASTQQETITRYHRPARQPSAESSDPADLSAPADEDSILDAIVSSFDQPLREES